MLTGYQKDQPVFEEEIKVGLKVELIIMATDLLNHAGIMKPPQKRLKRTRFGLRVVVQVCNPSS